MAAAAATRRPERQVTFEDPDAWMQDREHGIKHSAGVLRLDDGSWETREIWLRKQPFAQGGQRNAYHLFYGGMFF
eukprot:SAG31_NODE_40086_length_283_cov_0.847826_1_plen_74_part_01